MAELVDCAALEKRCTRKSTEGSNPSLSANNFTPMPYSVYILKCNDETLYTGITNDLSKRIQAHNSSKTGAKYTKARRPVTLQYSETYQTKSEALKREIEIKKFTRAQKLHLITPPL